MVLKTDIGIAHDDAGEWSSFEVTLPSGMNLTIGVGNSGVDGSALVQIDTGGQASQNLRVFVNDNDVPVLDENPETGDYQDDSHLLPEEERL